MNTHMLMVYIENEHTHQTLVPLINASLLTWCYVFDPLCWHGDGLSDGEAPAY